MRKGRIVAALLVALIVFCGVFAACTPQEDADELTVYNWADYIYDYEEDFKQYYSERTGRDVHVTYVTFDTNETMLTRVLKGDSTVDVICPSEYAIQKLLEAGALDEINYFTSDEYESSGNVNYEIIEKVRQSFQGFTVDGQEVDITNYFVPYMYGTLGILYNADVMEQNGITDEMIAEAGWGLLFNTDKDGNKLSPALDCRIFMKDSIRDSYAATVCYMKERGMLVGTEYDQMEIGKLINCTEQKLLDMVRETLITQKEVLYGYEVDFGKNDLIAGTAYVDLAWSGDALYAMEDAENYGVTLNYVTPESGGNIWFDGWVIPKNAQHKDAAKIFIDFLNQPDVAAENIMEIGYTSAVSKEAIKSSDDALAVLYEGYNVYAPDFWTPEDEDGNAISDYEYDFATIEEFEEYFFTDIRYPNVSNPVFGVMKDFGSRNDAVVMMWEGVRSTGVTAWALLLWTLLAAAVLAAAVLLWQYVKNRRLRYVVVKKAEK